MSLDLDAGALERRAHAAKGAVAVLGRRGDVEGVARHAVADDLGIDAGRRAPWRAPASRARPRRRLRP